MNHLVLAVRKPLFLLFVLGCAVSALASGRFSIRLILDGAVSLAFVPLIEIAAFRIVSSMSPRAGVRWPHALDLYLAGNAPWLIWLVLVLSVAAVVPPRQIGFWIVPVLVGSLIPLTWSIVLDFRFLQAVMKRPARSALRDVLLLRAIGWLGATAYFFGVLLPSYF